MGWYIKPGGDVSKGTVDVEGLLAALLAPALLVLVLVMDTLAGRLPLEASW